MAESTTTTKVGTGAKKWMVMEIWTLVRRGLVDWKRAPLRLHILDGFYGRTSSFRLVFMVGGKGNEGVDKGKA